MLKPNLARFKPLDAMALLFCLAIMVLSIRALPGGKNSEVIIYRDNRIFARYPLSSECAVAVRGTVGSIKVRISGGSAWVAEADCPEKICMLTGRIHSAGQQIICAPNHVLVTISSGSQSYDAISQ